MGMPREKAERLRWSVYVHTNKINGKKYVGITSKADVKDRFKHNGYGYNSQEKFYRAIKKYGWDNFDHEIIASDLSVDEATQMEKDLIKKYDSFYNGYNASEGGESFTGFCFTEYSFDCLIEKRGKKVVQFDLDGNRIAMYRSAGEAMRKTGVSSKKISKSIIETMRTGKTHRAGNFQWRFYEDVKDVEHIEPYRNANFDTNKCPVVQFSLNGERIRVFDSILEAAKSIGVDHSEISICVSPKNKMTRAGDFQWRKLEDVGSADSIGSVYDNTQHIYKKVVQFSLNGERIMTYNSLAEAAKATGLYQIAISNVANPNKKVYQTGGYQWKFYSEVGDTESIPPYNSHHLNDRKKIS